MTKDLTAYPVDHLSHSAIMTFLRNRFAFKKGYILKIFDFKSSPATLVGKAGHKALEIYYKNGNNADEAAAVGMAYLESTKDSDVEWGKTGSLEKVINKFNDAFNGYISEFQIDGEILGVEKSLTSFIKWEGEELALPIKSISDLIVKNSNGIDIIDHKFIATYTDGEVEDGALVSQAMCNYFNVLNEYGEAPKRMIFNEYKVAKNKNSDAQLQPYIINFEEHANWFDIFINIYNDITRELAKPDCLYLPNFQDRFDYSGETFSDYKKGIVTVENPIVVNHKTGDFQFKEKAFVSAPVDVVDNKHLTEEEKIRMKLLEFGIPVEMSGTNHGSSIIQYTLKASRGVKMSKFEQYSKDLALTLKAQSIRIQAPIMGTDLVGVEVPNPDRKTTNYAKAEYEDKMTIPIGIDVHGNTVAKSLTDMPHLLVAGATGAGKSVMMNVIIQSLTDQNSPEELKFVLIDPKRVELSQFKDNPNLMSKVIYEVTEAERALVWLVDEMEARYKKLEETGSRNIDSYNGNYSPLHKIVVVIDEFADLMLQKTKGDVNLSESSIIRLAQKARAIGIHLVLGTQRPSVDVISGLIKANMPTRICFTTASRTDSQVVLDQPGAEELVGKGDLLFLDPHVRGLQRLQGFYL